MKLEEFNDLLIELSNFYERKEPKQSTIELWYRLVNRIPSEPVKWITKKIEASFEAFPRNLTAALWSTYNEWQQAYPEKKTVENYFECPDCVEGLIYAKKKNKNNINYTYIGRCSLCKQSKCREYPTISAKELKDQGYVIAN